MPAPVATTIGARYLDEATVAGLRRELRTVHRRGFAVNHQETEAGLTAVGAAVLADGGAPPAAISLAMPSARYSRDRLPAWGAAVTAAAAAIAADLAA